MEVVHHQSQHSDAQMYEWLTSGLTDADLDWEFEPRENPTVRHGVSQFQSPAKLATELAVLTVKVLRVRLHFSYLAYLHWQVGTRVPNPSV